MACKVERYELTRVVIFKIGSPDTELVKKIASLGHFESKAKIIIASGDIHVHARSRKVFLPVLFDVMEVQTHV